MSWTVIAENASSVATGAASVTLDTSLAGSAGLGFVQLFSPFGTVASNADITDSKGNAWTFIAGRSGNHAYFYSFLTSVGTGHSITDASSGHFGGNLHFAVFSPGTGTNTLDGSAINNDGNAGVTSTVTGQIASAAFAQSGDLLVSAFEVGLAGVTPTISAGTDLTLANANGVTSRLAWEDYNSTANAQRTWTVGSCNFPYSAIFAFSPGSSTATYTLDAAPGTHGHTGVNAGLQIALGMNAAPGTHGSTGAGLTFGHAMGAGVGTYDHVGADAQLQTNIATAYTMNATPGSYDHTGIDLGFVDEYFLAVDAGTHTHTGANLSFRADYSINAAPGVHTTTGAQAYLRGPNDPAFAGGGGSGGRAMAVLDDSTDTH